MFYPTFTLLLAALLLVSPAPPPASPAGAPQISNPVLPRFVAGDSAVYQALAARLARHQAAAQPEKLYLHLDRTLFRPGETLWFNAYLRNAGDLLPAANSQVLHVQLLDPRGSALQQKDLLALDGTAAGEFDLPPALPGGIYRIKAWTNWMLNTGEAFEREITLQKLVLPKLNLQLKFERKAHGPGDEVTARFDARALDNQPLAHRELRFSVSIAGKEATTGVAQTDAAGRALVRFTLPAALETTDGLLNIRLEHNGETEAISRAVPIVLNRIDLQFLPEGGDLVGGLPGRLAFKAVNEFGKPADVAGRVFDSRGRQVTAFESFHDGMGAFDFVPQPGERYTARLTKPAAGEKAYELPAARTDGFTLRLLERDDKSLTFEVSGARAATVYLTGTSRDQLFFFQEIQLDQTAQTVRVATDQLPIGIARFTLFDEKTAEQAERLVFVNRDRGLHVEITPNKTQYLPREKVRLDLRVRDHLGVPVRGAFSLAVADENLLTFADDKQGHLLASLLLEQDLRGKIEEPNFYFDPAEPKAAQALDYLLLTQGWRRFGWEAVTPAPLVYAHPPETAVLEGHLLQNNGKPWREQTVQLYPNGPKIRTDKQGRFSFRQVDLSQYSHLAFPNGRFLAVSHFQQNMTVYENGAVACVSQVADTDGRTVLSGTVIGEYGYPLTGASVKILKDNRFVRGAVTDANGDFSLTLDPGAYDLQFAYAGFNTGLATGIKVTAGRHSAVGITMTGDPLLEETRTDDLRFKQEAVDEERLDAGQIRNLPTRDINTILAVPAGVAQDSDDAVVRGARTSATDYYIDGIRVSGEFLQGRDVEQVDPNTGGTPADKSGEAAFSEVVVTAFRVPLIEQDRTATGATWTADQLVPRSRAASKSRSYEPYHYYHNRPAFVRAREFYSPHYAASNSSAARNDFRSTLYWNPAVRTDVYGRASVEFYASDAITNFRATLEGIGAAGQPGRGEQRFFVEKPVSLAVKTPPYVIAGDVLRLQIALTNKTGHEVSGVPDVRAPEHFVLQTNLPETVSLAAGETKVLPLEFAIGAPKVAADQVLKIRFRAPEAFEDAFETTVPTLDRGFPSRQVLSGQSAQNAFQLHLTDPVEGTLAVTLNAYPNVLEDVLTGMERMLRQPSGCFEQVSSSNYPNLLVLDLLRQTGTSNPEVEARAAALLADGYQKLVAYECKNGGFDWWGRDPGHEGLTAYGILEFQDMSRVFAVDQALIDRTVRWLLQRRDGKGGWKTRADEHGWDSDGVLGAYIAWAVAEAGHGQKFMPEINAARSEALRSDDPYQLGLVANALRALNDPRADELVRRLLKKQEADGSWMGATHSVMHGGGSCFRVETTALAALALMKKGDQPLALEKAMSFIIGSKNEYGYGSTQSTVLALKALVEYAKKGAAQAADGTLVVQVDGRRVAEQAFSTKNAKRLEIKNLERFITHNQPRIEVFFEGKNAVVPFDIEVKYASRQPRNARNCRLTFGTALERTTAAVGETVRLSAVLKNESAERAASPMIVLGIPAGLSLQPWQLKKLVDERQCDFYEIWDGFAVFHFEQLAPGEVRRLDLDLRAELAGQFEAPASQAFLYYENDQRVWSKPEAVTIQ